MNLHICDVCVTADWIRATDRCAAPNFEFAWSEHPVLDCARGLSSFSFLFSLHVSHGSSATDADPASCEVYALYPSRRHTVARFHPAYRSVWPSQTREGLEGWLSSISLGLIFEEISSN